MSQLLGFIANNWLLVTALIVILVFLAYSYLGSSLRGYKLATPNEAIQLINREDAVLVDVREPSEYQDGHIINAMHIPLSNLPGRLKELEKHKAKPLIVACRSGQRSAHACGVLKKAGFETVYNLRGGVMAWQSASLPLVKK